VGCSWGGGECLAEDEVGLGCGLGWGVSVSWVRLEIGVESGVSRIGAVVPYTLYPIPWEWRTLGVAG